MAWASRGKVVRPAEFACEWDVSEALVLQMIEDLTRRGYLQAVENCQPEQCAGCSAARTCSQPGLKLWVRK